MNLQEILLNNLTPKETLFNNMLGRFSCLIAKTDFAPEPALAVVIDHHDKIGECLDAHHTLTYINQLTEFMCDLDGYGIEYVDTDDFLITGITVMDLTKYIPERSEWLLGALQDQAEAIVDFVQKSIDSSGDSEYDELIELINKPYDMTFDEGDVEY